MIRRVAVFLLALLVTYVLAAAAATQSVLARLGDMGIAVTLGHRIAATGHDIAGMASSFLPLLAAGMLIAFLVTSLVVRWVARWRTPLFILAGAVAVIAVHVGLKIALDITPVATARTTGGLLIQALTGALGGYVYVLVHDVTAAPGLRRRRDG